jgi:hypothetical protein
MLEAAHRLVVKTLMELDEWGAKLFCVNTDVSTVDLKSDEVSMIFRNNFLAPDFSATGEFRIEEGTGVTNKSMESIL